MSKSKRNLRFLLRKRLESFGVDKQVAHHEVGWLLNRFSEEEVVSAIMVYAKKPDPINVVRLRLNAEAK
jgi:hypothetical protein